MPRRVMRCTRVRSQGGTIYARFSDKSELEFRSRADMRRWIAQYLSDDAVKAILLAAVLEDASDGTPLSQADGKRLTIDWAATPIMLLEQT